MIDPKIEEIRERADGRAKDPWTDDDERDCGLIETWCPGKMAADVVSLLSIIDELRGLVGERRVCADHEWQVAGEAYCSECDRWVMRGALCKILTAIDRLTDSRRMT